MCQMIRISWTRQARRGGFFADLHHVDILSQGSLAQVDLEDLTPAVCERGGAGGVTHCKA